MQQNSLSAFRKPAPKEKMPPKPRKQRSFRFRLIRTIFIMALMGIGGGYLVAFLILLQGTKYPELDVLRHHEPKLFTRVYDRNGRLIDIFSTEKRIILEYEDIPEDFVQALVAVEDANFFGHIGVSPMGIMSALKDYAITGNMRGASTLTQQLVKNITKDDRRSMARKFKEQMLAVQLEVMFTKHEILAMYANEIPLGNQQFGIASAAEYYFDKPVSSLSLIECATLAGIPQAPSRFNPLRNPETTKRRRNLVLDRMAQEGYLTPEQAKAAKQEPLVTSPRKRTKTHRIAGHFVDKIRKYLFEKYGEDTVRNSGWDVYTSLDMDYQLLAEEAVKKGLKLVDKRQGYRPADCPTIFFDNQPFDPDALVSYFDPSWHQNLQHGVSIRGLIVAVHEKTATVRIKDRLFHIGKEDVTWVGSYRNNLTKLFKVGDVPLFIVKEIKSEQHTDTAEADDDLSDAQEGQQEAKAKFTLALDQEPKIEGAFMATDPHTGDILAMVGSYDYGKSKFNRTEQAKRQVGSAFKPIIYGAALEQGFTLSDTLFDEPTKFIDPTQFFVDERGKLRFRKQSAKVERLRKLGLLEKPKPYEPKNYYSNYAGAITLRHALADSKNIVAVKLLNALGYDHVIDYAFRLGLGDNQLQPFPSLALGSIEMSLTNLVYAYGTFAMDGIRFKDRFVLKILDKNGRIVEENRPQGDQVISPENAYLVTQAMTSVVQEGTAKRAKILNLPLAGKTGTTDDWNDAWFIGYSPEIVAGVWVGHDKKIKLWDHATGTNTALPIWVDFCKGIKKNLNAKSFSMPPGIVSVPIDKTTGRRLTPDCDCDDSDRFMEYYRAGTEPIEPCTQKEKSRHNLPWYLQKRFYTLDQKGDTIEPELVIIDYASQLRANKILEEKSQTIIKTSPVN